MLAYVFLLQGGLSAVTAPGFSFLGQGYDILKGNPLATTGFGDPGHRVDIFDFSFAEGRTTNDGRYRVADLTTFDTFQTCSSEVSIDTFNSAFSYQRLITNSFDINANFGPASFTLGIDSKNIRKKTENRQEIYSHATAVCTAYQLTMFTGDQAPVNSNFQHFVKNLPVEYDQSTYMRMIKEFGTHYINRMKLGGRWGHQMVFKTSDYIALEDNSINFNLAIKAAVAEAGKAGGGLDLSHVNQRTSAYNITQQVSSQRTFNIGGEYREDSEEWMETVRDAPLPVHMALTGLETLFTQEDLPMETDLDALEKKKANFVRATEEYCSYTKEFDETDIFFGDGPSATPFETFGTCTPRIGTSCIHAGEWLGQGTSLDKCRSMCPNGFLHAIHGDHNCKCLTGPPTDETCDEEKQFGVCTFLPTAIIAPAEEPKAPEFEILGDCQQGLGNECWESGEWHGEHTSIEWCGVLCPNGFVHATHGDANCKCITRSDARNCPLRPDTTWGMCTYVPTADLCLAPPTEIPFPQPTPVYRNAVRRVCVRNLGGFAINWFLLTNGNQGSRQGNYPNPQTRCIDASVDQPRRGDRLSCRVKAVAGRTVNCEDADVKFDARSSKQANYVCRGSTLRIRCEFTGISGLSGNN